jgi:hypothetical protein
MESPTLNQVPHLRETNSRAIALRSSIACDAAINIDTNVQLVARPHTKAYLYDNESCLHKTSKKYLDCYQYYFKDRKLIIV